MKIKTPTQHKAEIVALLGLLKQPNKDLPDNLDDFLAAFNEDGVIGVAGLEKYGKSGLLRSVGIRPEFCNQGIAGKLIAGLESYAVKNGLEEMILLTETASAYFIHKGYHVINRDDVADQVKMSSEFSYVCPQSAVIMKKVIKLS